MPWEMSCGAAEVCSRVQTMRLFFMLDASSSRGGMAGGQNDTLTSPIAISESLAS